MASPSHQNKALCVLHYLFPSILLAYFGIAQIVSICTVQNGQNQAHKTKRQPAARLQFTVLTSYIFEALLLVLDSLTRGSSVYSTDRKVYVLLELFIWIALSATLAESGDDLTWYPFYGSWSISIATEIVLFSFEIPTVTTPNHDVPNLFKYGRMCLQILRVTILALLILLYFHERMVSHRQLDEEESTSLLHGPDKPAEQTLNSLATYGSAQIGYREDTEDEDDDSEQVKTIKQTHLATFKVSSNWITYFKRCMVFVPLLWPSAQLHLQLRVLGVIACLIGGRILNLLVPRQLGLVVDAVSPAFKNRPVFPGIQLGLLLLYRFLASYRIIGEVEAVLWLPVGQHAAGKIKSMAHKKAMALPCDAHTQQGSGEIIGIVEKADTVIWMLRKGIVYLLPCALDILVFAIYMSCVFGIYMALILSITFVLYIWVVISLASRHFNLEEEALRLEGKEARILHESVAEWDTVASFNGQAYEESRSSNAIKQRFRAEFTLRHLAAQRKVSEEIILQLGFAIASTLLIYQIVQGTQQVGNFAMMVYYCFNALADVNSLSAMGPSLLRNMDEVELLGDLLSSKPSIQDGSAPFKPFEGAVLFSGVNFARNDKEAVLQNFNFSAKASQRVAIVGETSAGKRTIFRLLMRFHDVQAGKIMIDGQDIRDVTLCSLRKALGIIPSNPALFNDTIMENVRYANLEASEDEVIEACKEAEIHANILSFKNGYQTKVGGQGLKLSDGERQRIAIARVILKNPSVVLLDETATFADPEIENSIQKALSRAIRGKTTLIVTNKLITIKDSDVVIVLKNGSIVEEGSITELVEENGEFARLWRSQFSKDASGNAGTEAVQDQLIAPRPSTPKVPRRLQNRSSSSFRPEAPEFVPHQLHNTNIRSPEKSHPHLSEGHKHESGDAINHAHSHSHGAGVGKSDRGLPKRPHPKRNKKQSESPMKSEPPLEAVTASSDPVTAISQYDGTAGPKPTDDWTAPRSNRSQRRRMAKSDPHRSGTQMSQADRTDENRSTDNGARKMTRRRVSGPGKLSSDSTNSRSSESDPKVVRKPKNQGRRTRQHQAHLKNPERADSDIGSPTVQQSSPGLRKKFVVPRSNIAPSALRDKENNNAPNQNDVHASISHGNFVPSKEQSTQLVRGMPTD